MRTKYTTSSRGGFKGKGGQRKAIGLDALRPNPAVGKQTVKKKTNPRSKGRKKQEQHEWQVKGQKLGRAAVDCSTHYFYKKRGTMRSKRSESEGLGGVTKRRSHSLTPPGTGEKEKKRKDGKKAEARSGEWVRSEQRTTRSVI